MEPNLYVVKPAEARPRDGIIGYLKCYFLYHGLPTSRHFFAPGKFILGPVIQADNRLMLSRREDAYLISGERDLQRYERRLTAGLLEVHWSGEVPDRDLEKLIDLLNSRITLCQKRESTKQNKEPKQPVIDKYARFLNQSVAEHSAIISQTAESITRHLTPLS